LVFFVCLCQESKEKNEDPEFVKELLDLHDKFTLLVEQQFGANSLFQKALKVRTF
jgi:cullin 1